MARLVSRLRPARGAALRLVLALALLGLAAAPAAPAGASTGGAPPAVHPPAGAGSPASPGAGGRLVVTTTASAGELDRVPGVDVEDLGAAAASDAVLVRATPAAAASLAARPDVEAVEADVPVGVDSDPLHTSNWAAPVIDLNGAWRRGEGSGIVVAVLDTGVQPHVELTGRLLTGANVLADLADGRGDTNGHGTKSALTIAAARGDGYGAIGVCPRCSILPIRVLADDGAGSLWSITKGIDAALTLGADVISISASGTASSSPRYLQDAVARATHAGVPIVASAGNAGDTVPAYPAADPGVIGVAASTVDDDRYSWSSYGSWVDVAAPGCYRVSNPWTPSNGGWYCGTSAAAPVVSGALALARSAGQPADVPTLRATLRTTSTPVPFVASGRLDACGLVSGGRGPDVSISAPAAGSVLSGDASVTYSATGDCGLRRVTVHVGGVLVTSQDIDGTDVPATRLDYPTAALPGGATDLTVTVTDVHGLSGSDSLPITIGVTLPPLEAGWFEGDVDGNGDQDVIGFDPATGDWLVVRHGSDTVTRWANYRTRQGWTDHVPGDFNGDGRTDVLSFHQPTGRWWLNTSTGTSFTSRAITTFATRDGWSDHLAADLDGNGTHTLLSFHPPTGRWFTTNTTPTATTLTRWAQLPPARTWGTHQIGNFDGHPSGAQQVVSFDTTDGNWHHLTDTAGTATIRPWGRYNTRTGWETHLVGNFRTPDRDDLASYHPGTGTWWVSAPDTTNGINPTTWARFNTRTGWQTHIVGDIDRNGRDSIISYHPGAGSAWISDSTGTTFTGSRWTTYKTRTGWSHHTILHPRHGTAHLASYHPTTRRWFTTTAPDSSVTFGWAKM